jgi:uncharacterized membrane protein YfcA
MTLLEFFLAAGAVLLGSIIQSVSGVGGGFLMVPLLAMINVAFLPGPMIFATLALSILMAWREREHIAYTHVASLALATVPGAYMGAWLLTRVPADRLGVIFGSMILLAIGIAAFGLKFRLTRFSSIVAGLTAGTMGASSGIGAPAIAVLFQDRAGPNIRATLALIYTLCSLLIVAVLVTAGRFSLADAQLGFLLMPGMLLGYVVSRPLTVRFDSGGARFAVLAVSGIAAVTLIVNSL